jgi:SAM-dependent methyltransferase
MSLSGQLFEPRFFERFVDIEATHFWFVSRRKVLRRLLAQITSGRVPGYRVLEVGCGHGGTLDLLRDVCLRGKIFAFDLELEGIALAHSTTSAMVMQADAMGLPFGRDFSVVCLFDVLEHIPDDRQVLRGLFGLLADGGQLILTVPAGPSLWSYFDLAVHHQRRYRLAELEDKITAAGFEVEYLTYYMAALFPLLYLKRWWSKLAGRFQPGKQSQDYDLTLGELSTPNPFVNRVGALLLACEPSLIGHRFHLPIGTSLVAVARRPSGASAPAVTGGPS